MKITRIFLSLMLIFSQLQYIGFADIVPPQLDTQPYTMGVGYDSQKAAEQTTSTRELPAINIPGSGYDSPAAVAIAPSIATAIVESTSRGLLLTYDTKSAGWAGAGFNYDDPSTATTTETANFSGLTNLIIGLKGSSPMIKFEIIDKDNKKAYVYLDQIRSDVEQIWSVPLDYFASKGLDLSNIKMLNYIVEGNNQTGTLEVNRSNTSLWDYPSQTLTYRDINVPSPSINTPSISALAPNPANVMATLTERGIRINYSTSTDGWAGGGFSYDNLATADKESFDLKSTLTGGNLVIGIKGDPLKLKMEIIDNQGHKDSVMLAGVTSAQEKVWSIQLSEFQGVDLNNVCSINFIVEGQNQSGYFEINRFIDPVFIGPNGNLSAIDVNVPVVNIATPAIASVAPAGATATVERTEKGLKLTYNTVDKGWAGVGISYDNATTTAIEYYSFAGLSNLIIGLKSSAPEVKLELVDADGKKSAIYLKNASSTDMQYYSIPLSNLIGDADLSKIASVYLIVEGNNKQGTIVFDYQHTSGAISYIPGLTRSDINVPVFDINTPGIASIAPAGASASASFTPYGLIFNYNTFDKGWVGAGITYDDLNTTNVEYRNLSGLGNLIISLKGSSSELKFEIVDANGNKSAIYLRDVSSTEERYYSIPFNKLVGNADLSKVAYAYVVVEGNNKQGTLELNYLKNPIAVNPDPSLTINDVNLPLVDISIPSPVTVVPPGAVGTISRIARGFLFEYDTKLGSSNGGWAGAGFSYDDGTTTGKEYYDLSGLGNLILGAKGSTDQVKLELVDADGKKSAIYLKGISAAEEQFYSIPMDTLIGNVDLTRISFIYAIVEGDNKVGTLEFNFIKNPVYVLPSATLTQADITMPGATLYDPSIMGASIDPLNSVVSLTPRGLHDVYNTGTDGWAGAGFSYDDFFTTAIKEYKDLSGVSRMVFGVKGTSSKLKIEFIDKDGNKSAIYLAGISSTLEQFYAIQLSSLVGNAKLSGISYINFIVEGTSLTGSFDINRFADQVTINPSTNVQLSDINLPFNGSDYPYITTVAPVGATANTTATPRGLSFEYDTKDLGWAGTGFSYDNQSTLPIETFDFSAVTYINLGLKGSATKVKVEFEDKDGKKAVAYLNNIDSSTEKAWSIPTAILTGVDLANIRFIYFIVEGNNQAGTLIINRLPDYTLIMPSPTATGADINIPIVDLMNPGIASLAPAGATADVVQSERGLTLTYDTATGGWVGCGFSYDNGVTTTKEYYDFSSLTQITLGVKGSSERVKLELVDINNNKSYTYLYGVSSTEERFFVVPLNQLTGNVDLTKVMAVYVIVEGKNRTGTVEFNYRKNPSTISYDPDLTVSDINVPSLGIESPDIAKVAPEGATANLFRTGRGLLLLYETLDLGWAGAGFTYDNFGTTQIENYDLSALANLVIGLRCTSSTVKLEIVDSDNKKSLVYLSGLDATQERIFSIPLSDLLGNADLTKVASIYVVVEGNNKSGLLEINRFASSSAVDPSTPVVISSSPLLVRADISLPSAGAGYPGVIGLATNPANVNASATFRGLYVSYSTSTDGWAGGGFTYDNLSTIDKEYHDFSQLSQIVLGIKSTSDVLKFEIVDNQDNKAIAYLIGIGQAEETFFAIPLASLYGTVDLTKVCYVNFVVEGNDKTGSFEVYRISTSSWIEPSGTLATSDINLPSQGAYPVPTSLAPEGASAVVTSSMRGLNLTYNTYTAGWVGAGFSYDDFGTPSFETKDFSGLSNIVIGLKGDPQKVKVEIIDSLNNKASVYLNGISPTAENVWSIPVSALGGMDITKIRLIYFIVEGENQAGNLIVNNIPTPRWTLQPSSTAGAQDINIPGGADYPWITSVAPSSESANVSTVERGVSINYNTQPVVGDIGKYTTPTNIGFSLVQWLLVAKSELQVSGLSQHDALTALAKSISSLANLPSAQTWHGFFYNYELVGGIPQKSNSIISQADNGNMAASLAAVVGALKADLADTSNPEYAVKNQIVAQAQNLLNAMDWNYFVDNSASKMYLAVDTISGDPLGFPGGTPFYADYLMDELRLGVIFGIAEKGITTDTWNNLTKMGTFYTTQGGETLETLKSGDGGLFQALLPSIFLKESVWSPDGFGMAEKNFVLIQDDAATKNGLLALLSASTNPYGSPGLANGYDEFGVRELAIHQVREYKGILADGSIDATGFEDVGAPYASALAYLVDPVLSMNWLAKLDNQISETPFGYRDAIGKDGSVSPTMLSLDHGMFVASLYGNKVSDYVQDYLTGIGKLDLIKSLYGSFDLGAGTYTPPSTILTPAQEAARQALAAEHFLAFKDIYDSNTGWVYDKFEVKKVDWAGGGFTYDNPATPDKETIDLSDLTDLIFGIKGSASQVKMEIIDSLGQKAVIYLNGIDPTQEKVFTVPSTMLQTIDRKKVSSINFIVEGDNRAGSFQVTRVALISPASPGAIPNIPGNPDPRGVAPDPTQVTITSTSRGMSMAYSTRHFGWAGGGFSYDLSGTPSIETRSFLGYDRLVFGLKGTASMVKFEIFDIYGNKSFVYLTGIDPDEEQVWEISTAILKNIDLAAVQYMYFIVEGNDQDGTLDINIR